MKTKNKKHFISINGKKVYVLHTLYTKEKKETLKINHMNDLFSKVKIDLQDIEFDSIKEFYYFINQLSDIAEEIKEMETFPRA